MIDFGIGALDSSVPESLEIYPLQEDPFVVVMRRDDPLAESHHLPWRQLAGVILRFFPREISAGWYWHWQKATV